jgi:hypothetical protein
MDLAWLHVSRTTPLVGLLAVMACTGDGTTAPEAALSETLSSAHYVYHMAAGDVVDSLWQERYYDWVVLQLGVQPNEKLDYFKYRDRAHLQAVTGRATNGFAEPGTTRFHTIWPIDNHEGVHTLVILNIGHPPALFNEGVAVAHQTDPMRGDLTPRWNGQPLHAIARDADTAGRLPSLAGLLTSRGFFDFDQNLTYPIAGSFVRYLIDMYSLARFKALLAGATFDDAASRTETRFFAAYGKTLNSAWAEWRGWLRQQ